MVLLTGQFGDPRSVLSDQHFCAVRGSIFGIMAAIGDDAYPASIRPRRPDKGFGKVISIPKYGILG